MVSVVVIGKSIDNVPSHMTTLKMTASDHVINPSFPLILEHVYTSLQEQNKFGRPTGELLMRKDGLNFLGVSTELKDVLDLSHFRQSIGTLLGLSEFRMVQVVGDSDSEFSTAGVGRARQVISSFVDREALIGRETIIEYGYTGTKHDTNWIVNDLIATMPYLADRVIANIVHMSATAVAVWGCEAMNAVSNFVLAYNGNETAFGDDVWLSDFVMSTEFGDKLIVLEGGPQAFVQSVNACLREVPVIAITGPGMRYPTAGSNKARFSAAQLLCRLHDEVQRCVDKQNLTRYEQQALATAAIRYLDTFQDIKNNDAKYGLILSALKSLLLEPAKVGSLEIEHIQ